MAIISAVVVDKHVYWNKMYGIQTKYWRTKRLGCIPLRATLDNYSECFDFILAESHYSTTVSLVILLSNHWGYLFFTVFFQMRFSYRAAIQNQIGFIKWLEGGGGTNTRFNTYCLGLFI